MKLSILLFEELVVDIMSVANSFFNNNLRFSIFIEISYREKRDQNDRSNRIDCFGLWLWPIIRDL